ncbi:MAG: nitronate monooxygenase [Pseudomonadota bacterium]
MIKTRLTSHLDIQHPIISAPMAFAAGGALAGAVTNAGGLGMIGGAYGDAEWLDEQYKEAGNAKTGCGFITWNLQHAISSAPRLLDDIIERQPHALMLSFGDPEPYVEPILNAGIELIVQVQTLRDAKHAADIGASIVVAQGSEAGGHGEARATMTLVPEVADHLARAHPKTLLCAAGGIADGRGLAAALMLGADGVLVGSRLWASKEASVHPEMHKAALAATGDDTIRSSVMDIARKLDWPDRYTARVLKNAFTDRWHGDLDGLIANAEEQAALWKEAWANGDVTTANTFVGESTGLIDSVEPVADIIEKMVADAERIITRCASNIVDVR